MSKNHKLYLECYAEVQRSFPGSTAHTLKGLANRLFNSVRPMKVEPVMSADEHTLRFMEVSREIIRIWPDKLNNGGTTNA